MKNICIFTEPKETNTTMLVHGIFYAYKSGYQIPVHESVSNEVDTFLLAKKVEGGSLSYIDSTSLIFTNKMPKEVKITPQLNNSKLTSTPVARHATSELSTITFEEIICEPLECFQTEKHLKNHAFYFLLKNGLYNDYHNLLHPLKS